jgi:hypothetical protein
LVQGVKRVRAEGLLDARFGECSVAGSTASVGRELFCFVKNGETWLLVRDLSCIAGFELEDQLKG